MTLLQPFDYEVNEAGKKDGSCDASADAPYGDGKVRMIALYVVELNIA
jgi:hypothetical protein